MTINGYRFIYAGRDSEEFGMLKCTFGAQSFETNDEESNIRLSKNPFKETWDFHGIEYTAPLQFKMTIAKSSGDFINSDEQRELKKWLCKGSFNWLQVEQNDMNNIVYYCIINNPRPVDVGNLTGGLEFQVTCDTFHAWSGSYKKKYTTVNGTLTFNFNNVTDYDNYILYPTLSIKPTINGNITIKNNSAYKTITINNCVTTEIITMDSKNDIIESSSGRILLDDWNKNFLELKPNNNNITLTGNFVLDMEYRLPIRVGG